MAHSSNFGDTTYTKVFVGGLAWETQRDTMRKYFEQFGEILEAVIITDRTTGRSKGYGFVTFKEPEAARRACLDATPIIDGRRANCNLASLGQRQRHQQHHGPNYPGGYAGAQPNPYAFFPPQGFAYPHYGYPPQFHEGFGYPQTVYPPFIPQGFSAAPGVYGSPAPPALPGPSGVYGGGFSGYLPPGTQAYVTQQGLAQLQMGMSPQVYGQMPPFPAPVMPSMQQPIQPQPSFSGAVPIPSPINPQGSMPMISGATPNPIPPSHHFSLPVGHPPPQGHSSGPLAITPAPQQRMSPARPPESPGS
eukprot:TRINITY_DN7286_c0_g1_i1.p1 TRINITY_DN7286_c0_g1~~TRINITY_DN7286_c0_g1_i1.p1  ORF type:complete len:305 (-),score=15.60 TRINITY_DN7286_c0_g1_i1:325-1239(-)